MDRIEQARRAFAEEVTTRAGCCDIAIREAFARVPRHEFVGPGPWQLTQTGATTSSSDAALVYQDVGMGLVAERGIPTGLPSLHARCLEACGVFPGAAIVHVGAGSGYYTAILAELVGERGVVVAYEVDEELGQRARGCLRPWPWVEVCVRSGVDAFEAVDRIYVSAGVEALPEAWLAALRPGGRLLLPLTPGPTRWSPDGGALPEEDGGMLLVRHIGSPVRFAANFVCRAHFVPCIGTEAPELRERLTRAFRAGTHERVRSLGVGPAPAVGVWFAGDGFWLSTEDP